MIIGRRSIVIGRHNEIRDLTATLLTEVCSQVAVEPELQPVSQQDYPASANIQGSIVIGRRSIVIGRRSINYRTSFYNYRTTFYNYRTSFYKL